MRNDSDDEAADSGRLSVLCALTWSFGLSLAFAVALQAFPAISSIKANNVDESEQGTIQVRWGIA